MNIKINNISKIHSADIKLNGLTVIAGENGSGKSTIGKMLFSVVQVLKATKIASTSRQSNLLDKHISALYTRLRSVQDFRFSDISRELPSGYALTKMLLNGEFTIEQLDKKVNDYIVQSNYISPRTKANITKDLRNIKITIEDASNRAAVQASSIQYFIETEFMNSACSIGTESSEVCLEMSDSEQSFIRFSLKGNNVERVSNSGQDYLEDATYVESPLYLHMIDTLNYSMQYVETEGTRPFSRSGMIPAHIKDFVSKMAFARVGGNDESKVNNDIATRIQEVMKGSFQYDRKNNRLYYVSNGNLFSPINTASGIKSFGVLQLLLQSDTISPDRILIWDEPENHLHPEWQIKFADVIVQLSQSGIPIVISTHSPYFTQAIRYFAACYEAENNVNYYYAEECANGLSDVKEVTHDLNVIFSKLASPLNRVINVDNVRKH